ncbi:MAG: hypothetical protein HY921_06230 [Elusimicrobia bacterium]|nr:hypothetical protein [Elusimicrobiota bacterium]
MGRTSLDELISVVARLRSPQGCPWDRRQTHKSLIPYLREESKELEVALKCGRWHEIEDELGDVLLQVLLHAEIERAKGAFDIQDVAKSLLKKLIRRHPHVFDVARYKTAAEVLKNWDAIKSRERRQREADVRRRGGRGRNRPIS